MLLELLPCFQVAPLHHDALVFELVGREGFVPVDLLLQGHQVILVETIEIVTAMDITTEGEGLL